MTSQYSMIAHQARSIVHIVVANKRSPMKFKFSPNFLAVTKKVQFVQRNALLSVFGFVFLPSCFKLILLIQIQKRDRPKVFLKVRVEPNFAEANSFGTRRI